jgi:hypothetical protein
VLVAASSDVEVVRTTASAIMGSGFRILLHGPIAVLARSVPPGRAGSLFELQIHQTISWAVAEKVPVVPVPYGRELPEEPDVVDALMRNQSEFLAALEEVRDKAELGVTVARAGKRALPKTPQATTGRGYLNRLLAPEQESRAVIEAVKELLGRHCVGVVERPLPPGNRLLFRASCLVPAHGIDKLRRTLPAASIREARRNVPPVTTTFVTGPWAPYSFTPGHLLSACCRSIDHSLEAANA